MGNVYSAIASHSLHLDHRIGFNRAKIVYNSDNRFLRRTVEGALISLNHTFDNNKSSTSEDLHINYHICKKAGVKNFDNVMATFDSAASPLFSQVEGRLPNGEPPNTGAYAVYPEGPIPPRSPSLSPRITRSRLRR